MSRNWLVAAGLGLGAVGFYKLAPAADGSAGVTRWLAGLREDSARWAELNAQHLALAAADIEQRRAVQEAALPPTHRYRFPQ
jgi:hypothetical protein